MNRHYDKLYTYYKDSANNFFDHLPQKELIPAAIACYRNNLMNCCSSPSLDELSFLDAVDAVLDTLEGDVDSRLASVHILDIKEVASRMSEFRSHLTEEEQEQYSDELEVLAKNWY